MLLIDRPYQKPQVLNHVSFQPQPTFFPPSSFFLSSVILPTFFILILP